MVLNRYAALYSARAVGLLQSGSRIFLLASGFSLARAGPRRETTAGPSDREFIARRHRFTTGPGPGPTAAQARKPGNGGRLCLREAEARDHGLVRTPDGAVLLFPGKSLSLIDPSDSAVSVELKAAGDAAMDLGGIAAMSGWLGVYAGLMRQRAHPDASVALQGPDGQIVFTTPPEAEPALRGVVPRVQEAAVDLPGNDNAVSAAPGPPGGNTPAIAAAPRAVSPAVASPEPLSEAAGPDAKHVSAATPARLATAHAANAHPSREHERFYQSALQTLVARQGSGRVRSVSAMTQVHPAVDSLRALLP